LADILYFEILLFVILTVRLEKDSKLPREWKMLHGWRTLSNFEASKPYEDPVDIKAWIFMFTAEYLEDD
jgi:hypothetical protein